MQLDENGLKKSARSNGDKSIAPTTSIVLYRIHLARVIQLRSQRSRQPPPKLRPTSGATHSESTLLRDLRTRFCRALIANQIFVMRIGQYCSRQKIRQGSLNLHHKCFLQSAHIWPNRLIPPTYSPLKMKPSLRNFQRAVIVCLRSQSMKSNRLRPTHRPRW